MEEHLELLRREIEEAFSDVPYPGDNNIVSHKCWECDEILETMRGTHWKDWVTGPPENCRELMGALFLLTPEAYRFYFPAYLIHSIEYYEDSNIDSVISSLIPPNLLPSHAPKPEDMKEVMKQFPETFEPGDLEKVMASFHKLTTPEEKKRSAEYYLKRIAQFSPRQIAVIKSLLKFIQERHGGDDPFGYARLALENLPADTNA